MEVKICKNCKRMFNYFSGAELCQECMKLIPHEERERINHKEITAALKPMIKEEEDKYLQVKDYIMAHPNDSVVQIAEANDIIPKKLFEWIRADRLEFSDNSKEAWYECVNCGIKIKSGRLCNRCKN